jgi:hypothetical protein
MSKLSEQINYAITNKRAIDNTFDFKYSVGAHVPSLPKYLQQVSFEAIFGSRYYISEELTYGKSEVLAHTLKEVKLNVIEEIFGEFRKPLRELRHHLYDNNVPEALNVLTNLESQMFNV